MRLAGTEGELLTPDSVKKAIKNHMKTTKSLFGILTITAALAVQVHAQTFLTNGLVAFYPFSGNANDASGNGNNPVLNTASLTTDRFNEANSAYNFSGTQEIQYADAPQLDTITNLTVSCWVLTTNTYSGFYGLVCKATPSNPWVGFQVGVYQNHTQVEVDSNGFPGTVPINDGRWHSISAVFNHSSGEVEIFVDGNLDTTNDTPCNSMITTNVLNVGVERQSANFFSGSIDDIRIYDVALSSNEVAQLYTVESTPPLQVLKAVYLNDNSLYVGSIYQVQVSSDLVNWTNYGLPFKATSPSWSSTNYWPVANWNQLFFRLLPAS